MVIIERYKIRDDGVELVRAYSSNGMMIERDGVLYIEAIDPIDLNRSYIESDQPIPVEEDT
jgi:hypothetical protein